MWLKNYMIAILFVSLGIQKSDAQSLLNPRLEKTGLPSLNSGIGDLPGSFYKPTLPYLEEIKQIRSLKQSYDSLEREIDGIKEVSRDSTKRDSLLQIGKIRTKEVLDREMQTLESLANNKEFPGGEIGEASLRTLEIVINSSVDLEGLKDISALESLVDQNRENLKALTNEHLMPKIQEILTGAVTDKLSDSRIVEFPDFYGKGALDHLVKEGVSPEVSLEQAKSVVKEKALHLSDEYLAEFKGSYSKIRFDPLGNVEVVREEVKKKKFSLMEENKLKGFSLFERSGAYVWYDPLTSFGDGYYGDAGLGYHFSQQLEILGGVVFRRDFSVGGELTRTGQGAKLGIRLSKGNWFFQTEVIGAKVDIDYPSGIGEKDFEGRNWSAGLGVGHVIPVGRRIQSLVFTSWDPTYKETKSLSDSPFQLKIGFELKGLKGENGTVAEQSIRRGQKDKVTDRNRRVKSQASRVQLLEFK